MKKLFRRSKSKSSRGSFDGSSHGERQSVGSSYGLQSKQVKDLPKIHKAAWEGNVAKVEEHARKDPNVLDKLKR